MVPRSISCTAKVTAGVLAISSGLFFDASPVLLAQAADVCDQCFFTSDDADDCRVYGKIDGELVSWLKAPNDCLNAYQIQNTGIDPFSVGCDPQNVNTFVNSGLSGGSIPNSVLAGLGVSEGGFYDELNSVNVLKDSITVNGVSYDCKEAKSICYNAMKVYFVDGAAGAQEMDDVCQKILGQVRVDAELEQSDARNRICQDIKEGTTTFSSCGTLVEEVQSTIDLEPDKICAGFAFGPGKTMAPGCEGLDPPGGSGTGGTSESVIPSTINVLCVSVILLLFGAQF